MSRVNSFLLVLLALSSVGFGATLMQMSVMKPSAILPLGEIEEISDCHELFKRYGQRHDHETAVKLYNEAFYLSFNGETERARQRSKCASFLRNGSTTWDYEPQDLLGPLKK